MAARSNASILGSSGIVAMGDGTNLSVFREIPTQIDTDGYVWQLKYAPSPAYVWPILNGVTLDPYFPDGAPQFTLDGKILTLAEPVNLEGTSLGDDWFWVWYFRKGAKGTGSRSGKARQFGAGPLGGPGTAIALGRRIDWLEARVQINLIAPPTNGDTITIGGVTYVFATTINSILDESPNFIALDGNIISNLDAAINATPGAGGIGEAYSSATVANPDVVSAGYGQLQAKAGSTLDSITLTSSVSGKIQFSLPSAYLTFMGSTNMTSGIMHDGDTVTIGSRTYTFKDVITDANPYEILNSTSGDPGKDLDTPIRRLVDAINGGFGSGTRYSSATTANPDVTASYDPDSENMALVSKSGGAVTVALSESTGGRFFWSDSALSGGSGSDTDVLDWGDSSVYKITGDLSIGIYINLPSNAQGVIIKRGKNTGAASESYDLLVAGSSGAWDIEYLHDYSGASNNEKHTFATAIQNGKWVYIGISRDASAKTVSLYLGDGSTLTLIETWGYSHDIVDADATSRLTVGNDVGGSAGDIDPAPLVGVVEEHYIHNRVLSSSEHINSMKGNPSFTGMVLGCFMGDDPEVDIAGSGEGEVTGTTLIQGHN